MKFIKSYKIFESKDLELDKKLNKLYISAYTLNEDGSIDTDQDVVLSDINLTEIPFKFNKSNYSFSVFYNKLTSLKNCPKYIEKWFNCSHNKLESLEFGPEYVGYSYYCNSNQLITLEGCDKTINGNFDCSSNLLTTLEYGPEYVNGYYNCFNNKLITLKGCIDEVYGDFLCQNNKLISLEFCPMQIEGNFNCSTNKLEYLDRSPLIKGNLFCKGMFKTEPEFNGSCEQLIWK